MAQKVLHCQSENFSIILNLILNGVISCSFGCKCGVLGEGKGQRNCYIVNNNAN